MQSISVGPNGIFFLPAHNTVRCGDFSELAQYATTSGRLMNRHGEALTLTTTQREWLARILTPATED